jgi:hypothetical protein
MDKIETPVAFKRGDEFQRFFDADARRLADGVRKVCEIGRKWPGSLQPASVEAEGGGEQGVRRQILAEIAEGLLVEVGVRRVEAGEERQPPGPEPALLLELALSGGLGRLSSSPPPPGSSHESPRVRWRNWRISTTWSASTNGTMPTVSPTCRTG